MRAFGAWKSLALPAALVCAFVACGGGDSNKTSSSAAPPASTPAAVTSSAAPAPSASQAASKGDEVDVDALLASGGTRSNLVAADAETEGITASDAPKLGGMGSKFAAKAPADASLITMLDGKFTIVEPKGWKKGNQGEVGLLASPDENAVLLFAPSKKEDIGQKIESFIKSLNLDKADWNEPKVVRLGNSGVPAKIFGGQAKTKKGEEGSILFAAIETGLPTKILAILIWKKGTPKEVQDTAISTLVSFDKKQ